MSKLVTQDTKGPWGVTESTGDLMGAVAVDKEGTQGLVLPVQGLFRCQEELRLTGLRYPIAMIDRHDIMLPPLLHECQHLVCLVLGDPISTRYSQDYRDIMVAKSLWDVGGGEIYGI